jgi:hypothetical protein
MLAPSISILLARSLNERVPKTIIRYRFCPSDNSAKLSEVASQIALHAKYTTIPAQVY